MIYINTTPVLCLVASATSAYLGIKSACRAFPSLVKPFAGSTPFLDRIQNVVKETISSEISVRNLFLGPDNFRERIYSIVSGLFYSVSTFVLFFLAYSFFYESLELHSNELAHSKTCFRELNQYEEEFGRVMAIHDYWKHNLCTLDQDQWGNTPYQMCLSPNPISFRANAPFCNDFIIDATVQAYSKDILPRQLAKNFSNDLVNKNWATQQTCMGYLFEAGHDVHEKCSYLHPYIGFSAEASCQALQYFSDQTALLTHFLPFLKVSKRCLDACTIYEKKHNKVQNILAREIPKTKDIVVNCSKILRTKVAAPPQAQNLSKLEPQISFAFRRYLHQRIKTFNQEDWRNITKLKGFKEQERDLIEPWKEIDTEKNQKRLEYLKIFFQLRRKALRDFKAKRDYESTERELKAELPKHSLEKYQRNKALIPR